MDLFKMPDAECKSGHVDGKLSVAVPSDVESVQFAFLHDRGWHRSTGNEPDRKYWDSFCLTDLEQKLSLLFYINASKPLTKSIVTGPLDYFSLFGFFEFFKIAQNVYAIFANVVSKFCQTLNKTSSICHRFLKVCPNGEISQNLVTLLN